MMASKMIVKGRSISDYALDKCFLSMIYLLGLLTFAFSSILFSRIKLGNVNLFDVAILNTNEGDADPYFGNLFLQTFVELQYILPVTLLVTIEVLRIFLAWKMQGDKRLKTSTFANPHYTDDLGKVSHIVLDGKEIITTKEIEVKSISTPFESYRFDVDLLKGVLCQAESSSQALQELLESIVLLANSTSLTIQTKNAEDYAFLDMAEQLGYVGRIDNKAKTQSVNLSNLKYEVVDVLSLPTSDSVLKAIITKTTKLDKEVYIYFIKGTRSQLEEYMECCVTPAVSDFTHRGMKTYYFAAGVLDLGEVELLLNYYKPSKHNVRLTMVEKNLELIKMRPKNMHIVGSIGMRNKINPFCRSLFGDFKAAGLKTIILSQSSQECIKSSCLEAGLMVGDKFDHLQNYAMMNLLIKDKSKRNVDCIIVSGKVISENKLRMSFIMGTLNKHYDIIIVSDMTSCLKKGIVEGLLFQMKKKNPHFKTRLFNLIWPFSQKNREAVLVIGNSAHDVQMIQVADLSIYFDCKDKEGNFEDAKAYGSFSVSSIQDMKLLIFFYGIQNSFSVSKVNSR